MSRLNVEEWEEMTPIEKDIVLFLVATGAEIPTRKELCRLILFGGRYGRTV